MQFEIEQKPKFESYSHLNSFRPMQFEIEQKPQNIKKIILKSQCAVKLSANNTEQEQQYACGNIADNFIIPNPKTKSSCAK